MEKIKFIIIFVFITFLSFGFDYGSYKTIKFNELNEIIQKEKEANKNIPGQTQFGEKYKLVITLNEFPVLINETKDKIVIKNMPITKFDKDFLNIYTYKMNYKFDNQKYLFLFQGPLMKYLPREAKLNDSIELFIVLGIHDNINDEVTILVNEFNTKKEIFGL